MGKWEIWDVRPGPPGALEMNACEKDRFRELLRDWQIRDTAPIAPGGPESCENDNIKLHREVNRLGFRTSVFYLGPNKRNRHGWSHT